MNLDKAREAYRNDPVYHQLVEVLINQVETLQLTPSELREAAVFACIVLGERSTYPMMFLNVRDEMEEYWKFVLGKWDPVTVVKKEAAKVKEKQQRKNNQP